jgi:hypothetical protein
MNSKGFTTSFTVDRSPAEVFAVINDVRGWWHGDIEGVTDVLGEEFIYRHQDIHCSTQRIVELVPGARVAWRVTQARLSFTGDPAEWVGTEIVFDLAESGRGTQIRFAHAGLMPHLECYQDCSNAWGYYVNGSLRGVLDAGPTSGEASSAAV